MFKLRMIFIALLGLLHTQGFAMAAAGAGAAQAKRSHEQLLAVSIRFADIGAVKILLMDPATPISNERANNDNLITATTGGADQTDPSEDKKMIKLLLFFGFNPTYKELRGKSAQETAHELYFHDKDYSTWMDDYKNIEKYCSEQELAEFRAIKKERLLRIKEQEQIKKYKKFANLVHREIGGLRVHNIMFKNHAPASEAQFVWPKRQDAKDSSK